MYRIKFLLLSLMALVSITAAANGWLPPTDDIVVEYFNVNVTFDTTHYAKSQMSTRDSVFRYIEGQAVSMMEDKLGRFAVWRMLPPIVMVPEDIADKAGNVIIYVENAPVSALADTVKNADGDVLLPYSIWARAVVTDASGRELFSKDYGLLQGTMPLSKVDKDGKIKQAAAIVGINEAVRRVRNDVYWRFGFDMCRDENVCEVPESSKYYTFLKIVNGDVSRFVDFFTYNDLLSQIYKINYPFPFLPLDTVNSKITSIEGTIYKQGVKSGDYVVEFDGGRFKNFSGNIYDKDSEGKPVKQKINKFFSKYDKKTGEYEGITTSDGQFTRIIFPAYDNSTEWGVKAKKQVNVCRTENLIGTFIKMKEETVETVEATIDLYGKVYIDGFTVSSLPFGLFKTLADSNSVKFPSLTSESHTQFHADIQFDKNLNIVSRRWTGSVILEKDRGYNNYMFVKLDDCVSDIAVDRYDKKGNPVSFTRNISGVLSNNWNLGRKLKLFNVYHEGQSSIDVDKTNADGAIKVSYTGSGDIKRYYDDNDETVRYQIGEFEVQLKVIY